MFFDIEVYKLDVVFFFANYQSNLTSTNHRTSWAARKFFLKGGHIFEHFSFGHRTPSAPWMQTQSFLQFQTVIVITAIIDGKSQVRVSKEVALNFFLANILKQKKTDQFSVIYSIP